MSVVADLPMWHRRLQVWHLVWAFAYRCLAWHQASRNFDAVPKWEGGYIEASYPGLLMAVGLWEFVVVVPEEGVLM
jgi:hypothetical protein